MEYLKCVKGQYIILRNYRDAFNLEKFVEKYLEEYFDKYSYIVGDISSSILRLKGFSENPKSPNYYEKIDEYLDTSCAFGCPFYVLKRIKSYEEYEKFKKTYKEKPEEERIKIYLAEKENFDKENLVLTTSVKNKEAINIDLENLTKLTIGKLPPDLVEAKTQTKETTVVPKEEEAPTQTYVSASPDFDPALKKENNKNNNYNFKKNHKNKNNNRNRDNKNEKRK